jgi:hypothetical protein
VAFIAGTIVKSRRGGTKAVTPPSSSSSSSSSSGSSDDNDDAIPHTRRKISISPPLKGDEFEIYICYSRMHLKPGAAIDLAMQNHRLDDLVAAGRRPTQLHLHPQIQTPDTVSTSHLFPLTLLSFATILHGTHHHNPPTTHTGYTLQGTALHALNTTLSHPSSHTSDAVLLSVATLAILECLVPTSPKAYLNHMLGLERLLSLRDPTDATYTTSLSLALYKSVRHMVLFAALMTGRGCVFARREWKGVLRWACEGDEERQEQDLFDVLADCTVLGSGRDRLVREGWGDEEGFAHLRDEILRRALNLQTQLHSWRKTWASDARNAYIETRPPTPTSPDKTTLPPLSFLDFKSESAAATYMLYNTALIHVSRILSSLPSKNPTSHASQATPSPVFRTRPTPAIREISTELLGLARAGYMASERAAALDICRCVPYYAACAPVHPSPVVHLAVTTAWATLSSGEFAEGSAMVEFMRAKGREVTARGLWGS